MRRENKIPKFVEGQTGGEIFSPSFRIATETHFETLVQIKFGSYLPACAPYESILLESGVLKALSFIPVKRREGEKARKGLLFWLYIRKIQNIINLIAGEMPYLKN